MISRYQEYYDELKRFFGENGTLPLSDESLRHIGRMAAEMVSTDKPQKEGGRHGIPRQ